MNRSLNNSNEQIDRQKDRLIDIDRYIDRGFD